MDMASDSNTFTRKKEHPFIDLSMITDRDRLRVIDSGTSKNFHVLAKLFKLASNEVFIKEGSWSQSSLAHRGVLLNEVALNQW